MAISTIDCDHYRIPLPVTLSDSTHGEMTHFNLITVRIRDTDGVEGLGYTYTVGSGARAIRSLIADDLGPLLQGSDETAIEALWQRMWLLGGYDAKVRAYAGGIDLQFPIEQLLDQTRDNLAKGFREVKMKIGRDRLSEDVARVAAMRELLGEDFPLMADANMRWTADQAVDAALALAELRLYWLEEPMVPEDVAGHARLRRLSPVPIATGENFHSLTEFQTMIEAGGVSFPEPDVATCGGVTVWMKVAKLAESYHLPVTSHGVHDLHVHLLAAVPNASYLEVHGFGLETFMADPLTVSEGLATAPDRPGHGVSLDWDRLAGLRA
jgi:L-alanine-DL-glutamate epimerase-like enolase superfamily enzyme